VFAPVALLRLTFRACYYSRSVSQGFSWYVCFLLFVLLSILLMWQYLGALIFSNTIHLFYFLFANTCEANPKWCVLSVW
jgi:hypothetical protein